MPHSPDRSAAREPDQAAAHALPGPILAARCVAGGFLMGLANLVPGVSGGTMLLASGVYRTFIESIAVVSTGRLRARALVVLMLVIGPAFAVIAGLAGLIGGLVLDHRWAMYSLFIGLTLGGVPMLVRMIGRWRIDAIAGVIGGLALMAWLAWLETTQGTAGGPRFGDAWPMLVVAGALGGSAMVLPGVSGAFLLLLLGLYVPILTSIDTFRTGLFQGDQTLLLQAVRTIVPVVVGVVLGVVVISNFVRLLLRHAERLTLGFLLGMLVGAVLGLYPFREAVPPDIGETVRGVVIESAEQVSGVDPKDWPMRAFRPGTGHIAGSITFFLVGLAVSLGLGRLGSREEDDGSTVAPSGAAAA